MKIEHVAYQVKDPAAVAEWYVKNVGFSIRRKHGEPAFAHFLADDTGQVMIEIYNNPAAPMPDYPSMDPLMLHLAFVSADVDADRQAWIDAGATPEGDAETMPGGDRIAMLRDPWGFPIQLCRRAEPMI